MLEERIKKYFESYNKSEALELLRELAKFVDRLPALNTDEEHKALDEFACGNGLTLRETREKIESERKVAKDER